MTRLWPQGQRIEIRGTEDLPTGFNYQGKSHNIMDTCNRCRVHTGWWEPDRCVWREYLKITTDTGLLCLIYHDLLSNDWFMARLYD